MAFEVVGGGKTFYLGKLNNGEKFVGYLRDVTSKPNEWNGKSWSLIFQDQVTGEDIEVLCGGSAKYAAIALAKALGKEPTNANDKDQQEQLDMKKCVGFLVQVTKTGEYTNKRKQVIKTFSFARDTDKLLLDAKFNPPDTTKLDEIGF